MSSFFLHSVEERDGMGGVAYALLMFRSLFVEEFQFLRGARQAVSVLVTRPSCGDGQGMNYLFLGLYVRPLDRADWGEVRACHPFLSSQRACTSLNKGTR